MSFSIIITTPGDRAVGLNGDHVECHFEGYNLGDFAGNPEDREMFRASAAAWAHSWCDGQPTVRLSDECADCGKIMRGVNTVEGGSAMICENRSCPSSRPEEPSSRKTKMVTLADILTHEEARRAIALYSQCKPGQFANRCAVEIILPVINRINQATGQSNLPLYLAYAVENAINQTIKR